MTFNHTPVLLDEVLTLFKENGVSRFVDGTLGGAGHSSALLEALPDAEMLGIDQDPNAIAAATEKLQKYGNRARVARGQYADMQSIASEHNFSGINGILLDIGVSSPQIDSAERGFSFRFDGPLDMRMNPEASLTAAQILNTYSEQELADIFFNYGEERRSRQVARAVVRRREAQPWTNTAEFAELVSSVVGKANQHGLNPATRCFQALRIAVNDELGQLQRGLESALELLEPNGILAVISFHSLEDRKIKQFFNYQAAECVCPPGLPVCVCGKVKTMEVLTKKAIRPSEEEMERNPRSTCSKLRAAKKLDTNSHDNK